MSTHPIRRSSVPASQNFFAFHLLYGPSSRMPSFALSPTPSRGAAPVDMESGFMFSLGRHTALTSALKEESRT